MSHHNKAMYGIVRLENKLLWAAHRWLWFALLTDRRSGRITAREALRWLAVMAAVWVWSRFWLAWQWLRKGSQT